MYTFMWHTTVSGDTASLPMTDTRLLLTLTLGRMRQNK